ncbi:ZPR1 zinc finger domain-containing protein [Candidatus Woesearchaeota archaeon]|nr:ZPR1 zinc finger domain-containing protein [Candidatus Woesearchaeota archaeon]
MSKKKKEQANTLGGQLCPMCRKKTLTLSEAKIEAPYFGNIFVFSMNCSNCKYRKADLEAEEKKEPCKYTFEVKDKKDLNVRVIKSAEASVKIPHIGKMEPGPASEGFITNIEGLIKKFKEQIEQLRDTEEDPSEKKKAKNLLKKIQKVLWGSEKLKIIIEDPTGNSAIISNKAVKSKLKGGA